MLESLSSKSKVLEKNSDWNKLIKCLPVAPSTEVRRPGPNVKMATLILTL